MDACVERCLDAINRWISRRRYRAITNVILNDCRRYFTSAIPIRKDVRRDFKVITVEVRIDPLTLSLRANYGDVITWYFFFRTRFFRFEVANRRITRSGRRLRSGFPIFVFLFTIFAFFKAVFRIVTFICFTVLFYPYRYFFVFFIIVSAFFRTTSSFYRISELVARSRMFLRRVEVGSEANGSRECTAR